jgi:putative effector of murein hydrolase LrgA (UPF0299 family)
MSLLLLLLLIKLRPVLALRKRANKLLLLLLLLLVGPRKKLLVMGTKPSRAMQAIKVTMNSAVSVFWCPSRCDHHRRR